MIFGRSRETFLKELIDIPSVSGKEEGILKFLKHLFDREGWTNFEINVKEEASGILVVFGTPKVLFTTHVDVVEASKELFNAREENGIIYGRGACDAKASIVSMICACQHLKASGATDFGLFLFTGEERGGKGAEACMGYLQGFGIEHVIMGEPTKCRLATSQLGALCLDVKFHGSACHSAYSNKGIDANRIMIRAADKICSLDEAIFSMSGIWSVNLGRFYGGMSANTISPFAAMEIYIRTSKNNHEEVISLVKSLAPIATIETVFSAPKMDLTTLDGFATTEARMCSALHHFEVLNANLMMAGPGDPKLAHTKDECVEISELYKASDLYVNMYQEITTGQEFDIGYQAFRNQAEMLWTEH